MSLTLPFVHSHLTVHLPSFGSKYFKITKMKCMYWSNTTLFDDTYIYIYRERERERERIYYIKINYMFRPLTMAIFRLRLKKT